MTAQVGCTQELADQPELRAGGPPDVLSVIVARNRFLPSALIVEEPTYCRPNDDKRPTQVSLPDFTQTQVCPDDVAESVEIFRNAFPAYWYVRVVFDELLNLRSGEIPDDSQMPRSSRSAYRATSQPVILTCDGVEVPYIATYLPSGNNESWPVGPSIKIKPIDTSIVAANALCEITLLAGVIKDKSGNPPEPSQLGPYPFQIAPISLLIPHGAAAAPYGTTGAIPTLGPGNPPFRINFNHYLRPASFDAADVRIFRGADEDDPMTPIKDCGGGVPVAAKIEVAPVPQDQVESVPSSLAISEADLPAGAWVQDTVYRVEIGGDQVSDLAGGSNVLPRTTLCFRTR